MIQNKVFAFINRPPTGSRDQISSANQLLTELSTGPKAAASTALPLPLGAARARPGLRIESQGFRPQRPSARDLPLPGRLERDHGGRDALRESGLPVPERLASQTSPAFKNEDENE